MTANAAMIEAWDGDEGAQWAAGEVRFNAAVARHQARLEESSAIARGERVLDVGCGCGESTTRAAVASVDGEVLGVDVSTPMLERARARAREQGLGNARFLRADLQTHPLDDGPFDAIISRFGAMFFDDGIAAFSNIAGVTRSGGRLALLAWQPLAANEWITEIRSSLASGRDLPVPPPGVPGPFGLSDPALVEPMLESAGFVDVRFAAVEEPFRLGDEPDDAFAFFQEVGLVRGLLEDLDSEARTAALARLRSSVDEHATPSGVAYGSSSWLIGARRA